MRFFNLFVMRSRRCRKYYIYLFLGGSRPWLDFCIFQLLFIARDIVVLIVRRLFCILIFVDECDQGRDPDWNATRVCGWMGNLWILPNFVSIGVFFLLRLSPFGDMHSMRKNTTLSLDFATYNHSDSQNLTKSSCFCTFLHMLHICISRQREIIIFVRVLSYKTAFLFFSIIQHRLIDLRFLGLGSWPWCDFSTCFVMRSRRCRKYYIDLFLAGSRPWFDFCIFQFLFIARYIVVSIARLRFLKTRSGAKLAPPQI